jgi:hypothetical protein
MHTDVDSSFIHNCQKLEATKITFSSWKDKLWYIQTMEPFNTKKKWAIKPTKDMEETGMHLLLNERSYSKKDTNCIVPL